VRSFASALVIGLLLTLSGPAAVAGPADGERARFGAAVEALRGGDWREAARGFGAAAKRGGLLADYAQFFLAEVLARQGDLTAARRIAERLPTRHPESSLAPLALLQAAVWASRQSDEPGAESLLRRFLSQFAVHTDAPGARYLLGLSLEAQGRGLDAARALRELWLTAPASAYGEAAGDRVQALAAAGCAPAVLNAANEIAVGAFLAGRIRYTQIAELIALALERVPARALDSIETCVDVDAETRRFVEGRLPGGANATAAGMSGRTCR